MQPPPTTATRPRTIPSHLLIGIALIGIAWPMAWRGPGPWAHYTFFPLWLGYILAVDGITVVRAGSSLLTRNRGRFALLFLFSIPLWWIFEFANRYLQNWHYQTPRHYSTLAYVLLASLSFSTVMPAIFVTAAFYRTLPVFRRPIRWIRISPSQPGLVVIALVGLLLFVGSMVFPGVMFPFVWMGLFLLVDIINDLAGARSIAAQVAERRWDTVLVLFAAGLTCGFFWEMWNIESMPKWTYTVPHVGFGKIFEMPVLGYGGYLPFALEIYAIYNLFHLIVFRQPDSWLTFDEAS